jgi:PAS domain-containing protein
MAVAGAAGVVVRDRDNRLLEADPVALGIIGVTREQLQTTSPHGVSLTTLQEDGSPGTDRDVSALLGLFSPTAGDSRVLGLVRAGSIHWIAGASNLEVMTAPLQSPWTRGCRRAHRHASW